MSKSLEVQVFRTSGRPANRGIGLTEKKAAERGTQEGFSEEVVVWLRSEEAGLPRVTASRLPGGRQNLVRAVNGPESWSFSRSCEKAGKKL